MSLALHLGTMAAARVDSTGREVVIALASAAVGAAAAYLCLGTRCPRLRAVTTYVIARDPTRYIVCMTGWKRAV